MVNALFSGLAVRVRALPGLCSWTRDFALTVSVSLHSLCLSPPRCIKGTAGGNPVMDSHPIQERVEILLVASSYSNQDTNPACWTTWFVDRLHHCSASVIVANLGKITRRMPDSYRPISKKMASTRKYCDVSMTS